MNKINPFHELYVTESFDADSFVHLFSDVLINHTSALFKPGNVVLQGLPGTGKTMMLSLLKPSIRLAYKRSGTPFPVSTENSKFIGAGINLIRSSVADFGQRPVNNTEDLNELAVYFGDFINYWVVRDIILSVQELSGELSKDIGIDFSIKKLNDFAVKLKKEDCWFEYLDDVKDFESLTNRLKSRVVSYRSYLHFNTDTLPSKITNSKTAIGIPISATVNLLRKCGIIENDVQVYVRIDQYEELAWLDNGIKGLGTKFKSVINKLLAMRDASVSYRIGTRPFAWKDDTQEIFGTSARLEESRNYLSISIDEVLRRPENIRTYIFPKFAEDIFEKRLAINNLLIGNKNNPKLKKSLLSEVFGDGLSANEKVLNYVAKKSKNNILKLEPTWPDAWKNFLIELADEDPLSARLGEAWARQRGKGNIIFNIPTTRPFPWETKGKLYWEKERIDQALLQIASRNRQQLIWQGKKDILNLSGGNILAFLNLCQQIWEVWMRDSNIDNGTEKLPQIAPSIQTLGILEASANWFDRISRENGGKERKQFIAYIGSLFHKNLVEDFSMSNPGFNGFSIETQELDRFEEVYKFLKEASDFGDLQDRPHTTKYKNRKKRVKWYLNPILSPYFKIPPTHTKEPMYITLKDLISWLNESSAFTHTLETSSLNIKTDGGTKSHQISLF